MPRPCLQEAQSEPLRDTLIADAQAKVEHFEIASYQALIIGAQQMGQDEAVELLRRNLQWEQKTALDIKQKTPQLVRKAMQGS